MRDGFFDIIKGEPRLRAEALTVPEMYDLWKTDTTPDKNIVTHKIAYIYHSVSPISAYGKMGKDKREAQVIEDTLTKFKLSVDPILTAARDKYKYLEVDCDMAAASLEAMDIVIDKINKLFREVEITADKGGNLDTIVRSAKQLMELQKVRDAFKKQIEEGYDSGMKTKRDIEPNIFDEDFN